jgi:hypothetical protein
MTLPSVDFALRLRVSAIITMTVKRMIIVLDVVIDTVMVVAMKMMDVLIVALDVTAPAVHYLVAVLMFVEAVVTMMRDISVDGN